MPHSRLNSCRNKPGTVTKRQQWQCIDLTERDVAHAAHLVKELRHHRPISVSPANVVILFREEDLVPLVAHFFLLPPPNLESLSSRSLQITRKQLGRCEAQPFRQRLIVVLGAHVGVHPATRITNRRNETTFTHKCTSGPPGTDVYLDTSPGLEPSQLFLAGVEIGLAGESDGSIPCCRREQVELAYLCMYFRGGEEGWAKS